MCIKGFFNTAEEEKTGKGGRIGAADLQWINFFFFHRKCVCIMYIEAHLRIYIVYIMKKIMLNVLPCMIKLRLNSNK